MARWTGAGLTAGTTLSSANVNTAGNGDTVALGTSGTFTAVMQTDGVLITGAATSIFRFDLTRTSSLFGVGQMYYTPKETPGTSMPVYTFRTASAAVVSLTHFSTAGGSGGMGVQNQTGGTVSGSTSIALVVDHEYLVDVAAVVGTTTSNGRLFFRVTDLTDPTWNTTGEFFYDSGYTINCGTAAITQHRVAKVGNTVMSTGMKVRQIGWDTTTISTSTDPTVTKSQFMTPPSTAVTQAATVAMVGSGSLGLVPSVDHPAAVGMAGVGTLSITPAITAQGVVGMTGSGTLAATVTTIGNITGAVPLAGAGGLAVTATANHPATVSMSGSGTLSVAGTDTTGASVTLVGIGTLAVTGQQTITPNDAPSVAVESVTTGSALTVAAAGSLTFTHTVNAGVTLLVVAMQASASSGLSTVATAYYGGLPMIRQANALSSAGTTARESAIFVLPNPPVGTATVQLPARSSGTTYTIVGTAISLTGASGLYGTAATAISASATSISDTTTSPASSLVITSASIRSTTPATGGAGTSRLNTVYGTNNAFAVNTATGATSLANTYSWTTADNAAIVSLPVAAATSVVLAGTGTLGVAAAGSQTASATIAGTSTLAVAGIDTTPGVVVLAGVGALAVTPAVTHPITVTLVGSGALAVTASVTHPATIALVGSGTLAVTGTTASTTNVPMAGAGTLTVTGILARLAGVLLAGTGALSVIGTATHPAAIPLAGSGDLNVTGTLIGNIRSDVALEGVGQLAVTARDEELAALLLMGVGTIDIDGTVHSGIPARDVTVTILGPYLGPDLRITGPYGDGVPIVGPYNYPLTILGPTE